MKSYKYHHLTVFAVCVIITSLIKPQSVFSQSKTIVVKIDTLSDKITKHVSEEYTINGTIIAESDGLPLPGVNVKIKGTKQSTQADFDGKYKIKAKSNDVLEFSFNGFITQKKKIGFDKVINISLKENFDFDNMYVTCGGPVYYIPDYTERQENQKKWLTKNREKRQQWKAERLAKREAIRSGKQERTTLGKFFYSMKRLFSKK